LQRRQSLAASGGRVTFVLECGMRTPRLFGLAPVEERARRWVITRRRQPIASGFLMVLAFVVPSACASTPHLDNRLPNTTIVMSRVVVLPAITKSLEVDAFDKHEFDDGRTDALFDALNPEVLGQAKEHGALAIPRDRLGACGSACTSLLSSLVQWGTIAALEIAAQMKAVRNYGATSIADWNLQLDYTPLRTGLGADYVLFVVVRDLRESGGKEMLDLLVGKHTYFKQVGVACLVDLAQRRMTWCHATSDAWGDLRKADQAKRAVRELLSDFTAVEIKRPPPVIYDYPRRRSRI
jgi:hypothetical protein